MLKFIKRISNKYYIIFAAILAAIGVGYYFFHNGKLIVDQTRAENREVIKTVSASGKIKSENEANLSFKASGRISKINFQKGDTVKMGDVIAVLDNKSALAGIKSYKDALDIKLRDKDLFLEQYQDHKDLIGGSKEFDINLRKINEQISQAQAAYNSQALTQSDYSLISPINGIILDIIKKPGENATTNEVIVKIANPDTVIFETNVDQEDFGAIQLGQKAKIMLDAYDSMTFPGMVTKLPNFANTTGDNIDQFTVEITIDKTETPILIGMKGDAEITVSESKGSVPSLVFDELFEDKDDQSKKFIWTLENDKLHKTYIDIGLEGDVYTEVKTDLSSKVIVVPINKTDKLEDGLKAKLYKP